MAGSLPTSRPAERHDDLGPVILGAIDDVYCVLEIPRRASAGSDERGMSCHAHTVSGAHDMNRAQGACTEAWSSRGSSSCPLGDWRSATTLPMMGAATISSSVDYVAR
jgi:hypothetical protein